MKAYIFLSFGVLATFVEAAVQRQFFDDCGRFNYCPKGQEPVFVGNRFSMPRCRCAKELTLFEQAEDKGGGCINHVASCKQGDQRSCFTVTGDDCQGPKLNFSSFDLAYESGIQVSLPVLGLIGIDFNVQPALPIPSVPPIPYGNEQRKKAGIPNKTHTEVNRECRVIEPICEIEKVVELCDQRYISFAHECTSARKKLAAKNEAKCKQAKNECVSEAYFANSCSTLLQVCTAPDIVEYCKAGRSHSNIPQNTCNDYRVRLGMETFPGEPESFRRASERECVSYKQQCIDGNNSACSLVIRQCDQKYMNELCKAGKISDIYRCNVARANSEGPSYYCGQYLNKCFFFNGQDCDFALRYCDSNTITSKCAALGRSSKLCTNFKNLTSGKKYSQDECSKYTSDCLSSIDSMACKEVMYHCGIDSIKTICSEPSVWTDSMCDETKARLNIESFGPPNYYEPELPPAPAPGGGGFRVKVGYP